MNKCLLLCVVAAVCSLFVSHVSARPSDQEWKQWKLAHGKKYASAVDEARRRAIWEHNAMKIDRHNERHAAGHESFQKRTNRFSDMEWEEIQRYFLHELKPRVKAQRGSQVDLTSMDESDLPDSIDWRKKGFVTPVKDQGFCGSCWAFSTTGSLEGQLMNKTGKLVSLSEQQLVDCSWDYDNDGCNGGLMENAFRYVKDKGIESEESYPYFGEDAMCYYNESKVLAYVKDYVTVHDQSEEHLKKLVATYGPVSVAIEVDDDFMDYSSGIYDSPDCTGDFLNHGVLVVGYGSESGADYWIVKNSWSEGWGEDGYVRMARNKQDECGIANMASVPILA